MKTVIHIGAGNIGRGFVMPVVQADPNFQRFIFLDINKNIVDQIHQQHTYVVQEVSEQVHKLHVNNVDAYTLDDVLTPALSQLLNDVELITISIGQTNLIHLVKYFVHIAKHRQADKPLIVICCENGNRVSSYFKQLLEQQLPFKLQNIHFVDAVVDRIVPNQPHTSLDLQVEQYHSWIVDAKQWPDHIDRITSITYSQALDAEINKKICLLNGVHASIAWYRFQIDQFQLPTLQAVINDPSTWTFINALMDEIIGVLVQQFSFEATYLKTYKNEILTRFQNPSLIDELERIGRNPISKLQIDERILSPLLFAITHHLPHKYLLQAFHNGLNYTYPGDREAQQLKTLHATHDIPQLIKAIIPKLNDAQVKALT